MHLTDSQMDRYHRTVLSLFRYVDEHEGITIPDPTGDPHLAVVRTTLIARVAWRRPDLIDAFVSENPDHLPQDCLDIALSWRNVLFDEMIVMGVQEGRMLFLHPTGLYAALETTPGIVDQTPNETLWIRTALLPFEGVIIAAPPLQVTGVASIDEVQAMRRGGGYGKKDSPIKDAHEFCRRINRWKKDRERDKEPKPNDPLQLGPLPRGYHRGILAGLTERERTQAKDRWLASDESREAIGSHMLATMSTSVDHLPATLDEAIVLAEPIRAAAIAASIGVLDLESFDAQGTFASFAPALAARLPHEKVTLNLVLTCAHSAQVSTIRRLADKSPLDITNLSLDEIRQFVPLEPYSFVFDVEDKLIAWIAPELIDVLRSVDFEHIDVGRKKMQELNLAASMMVARCGVTSLDDLYERYARVATNPIDRESLEHSLTMIELYGNAAYSLMSFEGTTLLINPQIDDDFLCIAKLLMYHRDVQAPPLERSILTCEKGPIEWYCHQPEAVALRNFVDERIPDGEDDYSHADTMVLDAIISTMHDHVNYNAYMDLMRRYRMEGCEGARTSHAVGRLLTNLFNALPQWERNGWSAESDFERATGKHKVYNPDGTLNRTEPIKL